MVLFHGLAEALLGDVLYHRIDGENDSITLSRGLQNLHLIDLPPGVLVDQDPSALSPKVLVGLALNSLHPFVVDIHGPEDVTGQGAVRVEAPLLCNVGDVLEAQGDGPLLLLLGDLSLEPDEAPLLADHTLQPLRLAGCVGEEGLKPGELLERLLDRTVFKVEGVTVGVHSQGPSVSVKDRSPLRGDLQDPFVLSGQLLLILVVAQDLDVEEAEDVDQEPAEEGQPQDEDPLSGSGALIDHRAVPPGSPSSDPPSPSSACHGLWNQPFPDA
ncbi:MAG: hypothetical protein BWY86_00363 [Candidatus Aminicenantes bacterium ADurb.Bin508]|nr:MAG: hypothetical protein BWY86_00363 [Candidatus Aminicenantes bacterium ADurb.Bin508]